MGRGDAGATPWCKMTTAHHDANHRHPTPAELNRRLAWAVAAGLRVRQARHRKRRRLALYSLAVCVGLVALWLWPGVTLACVALGLPSVLIAAHLHK